jgi:hypothetical protein
MNCNYEQLENEFKRQIRLCSGLGKSKQISIMAKYWAEEGDPDGFTKNILNLIEESYTNGENNEEKNNKLD